MKRIGKRRHEASQAMIDLRAALGVSQAEFAIKWLDLSPITVYRLENQEPPSGEILLRLADCAHAADQPKLRDYFGTLFLNNAQEQYRAAAERWKRRPQ